jgi:hypothetical protein
MRLEQRLRQLGRSSFLRGSLGCVAFLASIHLAVPSAQAASEASLERAAKKACLAGDATKGVAILAELYVRTEDPIFIFNQGRCFEQNGKYEEAILRFREYLVKKQDAGEASDPAAEKHIANCQALLDSQRQKDRPVPSPALPAPSPAPAVLVPAVSPPPVAASSEMVASTGGMPGSVQPDLTQSRTERSPPSSPGAGLRIAGVAVAAVGVAGIVTGVVLNLKANSLATEIETDRPYLLSRESTRQDYVTWMWISYGVGAACLAGGAALYGLGYWKGKNDRLSFLPSAGPGWMGAHLQGAF